jgi:hypothetical protein
VKGDEFKGISINVKWILNFEVCCFDFDLEILNVGGSP